MPDPGKTPDLFAKQRTFGFFRKNLEKKTSRDKDRHKNNPKL